MSFICSSAALHTKLHICTQTNFHSQVEMIDGRWISTGKPGEIHQFGSRVCVMVSYRRSALKVLRCYLCCSILGKSMHIQQVHHSTHAHISTGCKNSPSFREFRLSIHHCFPNNIKKPFSCLPISSLPWCLSPTLLFSITFSSFLAFIYVPFSIIFLKRKINKLFFSTMRNST